MRVEYFSNLFDALSSVLPPEETHTIVQHKLDKGEEITLTGIQKLLSML